MNLFSKLQHVSDSMEERENAKRLKTREKNTSAVYLHVFFRMHEIDAATETLILYYRLS